MSELEAMGDAVTGAVIGRAVEPAGDANDGHTHETACLNCGTELIGAYCHSCGQHGHVHRTLGAFWHDLLHGVLHFEGKIWRTLPMLAWKPGELTRRYIDGQRARFVSPIALFLFSVFLMFAAVSLIGGPFSIYEDESPEAQARLQREYEAGRADALAEIQELENRKRSLAKAGRPTGSVDAQLRSARRGLALQETIFRDAMGVQGTARREAEMDDIIRIDAGDDKALGWFDDAYKKAKQNPKLLFYKLQTNAYKFSWALIPISVPFLWLLFLHRRRYRQYGAYDHTVFVTYSISFMTLGFVLLTALEPIGLGTLVLWLMFVVPPLHMYRQLRGAYALSRWSAAWRAVALLLFALTSATIFMGLLLLLGVLG